MGNRLLLTVDLVDEYSDRRPIGVQLASNRPLVVLK